MSDEKRRALLDFVVSEGRVWPHKWHDFSNLVGQDRPGFPPPLILGGAMESDASKRQRLIDQINHVSAEPQLLERADAFLRSLPLEDWYRCDGPLSGYDRWPFRFRGQDIKHEPAVRPSADQVRSALHDLKQNWVAVVGAEIAAASEPVRFTGRKRRRLLVVAQEDHTPPWGAWAQITTNPESFRSFRASINARLSPLHVDHIDFQVGTLKKP